HPDLRKIAGTPLERLMSKKLRRKLRPVFATSVHRVTVPVRTRTSEIELAIDRGRIVAGQRSGAIEEIELELKRGRSADLFRLAKAMEQRSRAELFLRSKSERGYDLAQGKREQTTCAEPIELDKDMPTADAFRVIAHSCVRHFSGNADAIRDRDPEGVHQMRVGLRRLRAAIALFSKPLRDARTDAVKTELKWLTDELAPAREIDVFVEEEIRPAAGEPQRGWRAIEAEFIAKRDRALDRANQAVASERYRALLLDVLEWIEETDSHASADARKPIGKFARDELHRRLRKVRKEGRRLPELTARERHKLRIKIKKIRYAGGFFESLFPARRRKSLVKLSGHLKTIQGALGSLNDFAAHRQMATDAALQSPPQNRRARAFASGVIVGREDEAAKPLMRKASKELGRLAAAF
ncbi:MAG: CHAD domain-containing protein, partial [Bradyrhizobium sp.]|nr:CHAD domain-containing protein [Bradyrhizobium sp.]